MKNSISINGREIGADCPPYVIAEMSGNHNGSLERALKTIEMVKRCGADAIKLQTYTADTITIDCDSDDFKISNGLWEGYTLYSLYKWAQTPFEWHKELFDYARKIGITCFSTPFDESAVDLLEDLNTPAYKIASFEIVDLPLIKYVAQTKKPMIISTGMASVDEIEEALEVVSEVGCSEVVLLHCTSGYPVPMEQANLRTIPDIARRFGAVSGLSDHTLGCSAAVASVALGASVIEKHVTLSRDDKGPDSEFSIEPDELNSLCSSVKEAWLALGDVCYSLKGVEEESIKYRRSLYAIKDIAVGERFTSENVKSIRPGFGLKPKYYSDILGRVSISDIPKGTALKWNYIK